MTVYDLFPEILSVSLPMTALIPLLWLLLRFAGGRFTAKCRYIVWTLVILRLCLPVGVISLPSLVQVNFTPETEPAAKTTAEEPEPVRVPEETVPEAEIYAEPTVREPAVLPVYEAETAGTEDAPVTEIPAVPALPERPEPAEIYTEPEPADVPVPENQPVSPDIPPEDEKTALSPLTLFGIVWLTGAVLYLAVHLIAYNRYVRRLHRTGTGVPAEILRIHRDLCKRFGLRRPPNVKLSRKVHTPLLCGYFRPCVFLPDAEFSPGQAVSILAHELTHHRRRDVWIKFACVFGCSLHWFNPAAHLAAARCCAEMELSCDEAVLAGMDEDARRRYGKVMLDLLRRGGDRNTVLTTQFPPKKRAVRERFLNIMDMSKKKRGIAVILTAAALCSLAGMVFAYDAGSPADDENFIRINDNVSIRIGFGSQPELPPEAEEDPAETEKESEKTDTTYEFDGITFTLPADLAGLVDVTESQWNGGLFDVYHRATAEHGAPGWLYSVCRHTYDELVRDDVNHGGIRYFAATPDNTAFYCLLAPTDVQFDPSDEETSGEYSRLSDQWKTLTGDVTAKNGLVPFDSSAIPDIVHLTSDRTVYPSYAPAVYPVRLEYDETHGWLLRGDGAGPNGMSLGESLKDADLYAEWVTETCCRIAADGKVYDLYRKDAVWAFEPSDFGFAWENNLPVWTISDALTAATESDLLRRVAYERMDTEEFLSLPTIRSAFVRDITALVEPYRPESPDTATVHGDPYYVPDGVIFPETIAFDLLRIERNPAKRQEWTVWFKAGEMSLQTTATVERENDTYRLALTDPEFCLLQTIYAEEGDLRPVLEKLAADPRTDYLVEVAVPGAENARLTVEISGEGRDLHQTKKIRLRSMKALGQTLTFDTPFDLWTVAAVHVFGADGAVVLDRLPTGYAGTTFLFTSRDIYEYNPGASFSVVLYEENDDLRYRHSSNLLYPQKENVLGDATSRDNFSYECGDVKISGGRPQFYAADEYYTIADVFDLDADFAAYWKSDAYPTLDALLLYNAERYRDLHDYPTDEETPRPAVTLSSAEKALREVTGGTLGMKELLEALNADNTNLVLTGSDKPLTAGDLLDVQASLADDGGLDVTLNASSAAIISPGIREDRLTVHIVPGEKYPVLTVEENYILTYRLLRGDSGYHIMTILLDGRTLPVPEENMTDRHILNSSFTLDETFSVALSQEYGDVLFLKIQYTTEQGDTATRTVAVGDYRNADWYFGAYLDGKYDMDTLMNHTRMVPVRVWNETKAILDAYRDGGRPSAVAPLFPADCAVPEVKYTDDILKYYRPSGESEHPILISFPLENGQTMEIYWRIEEENEEYTMIPRIRIQPAPNVLLTEEANWNWWITDPTEVGKRLPAGDFEYNVSEHSPEPIPSNKDGWSGFLLARTKFTVPDPTAELALTCTVRGYAQVWLYDALQQPSIRLAEFENADGTYTVPLTEEARQAILAGQTELLVHAEGTYFSLTLGEA